MIFVGLSVILAVVFLAFSLLRAERVYKHDRNLRNYPSLYKKEEFKRPRNAKERKHNIEAKLGQTLERLDKKHHEALTLLREYDGDPVHVPILEALVVDLEEERRDAHKEHAEEIREIAVEERELRFKELVK